MMTTDDHRRAACVVLLQRGAAGTTEVYLTRRSVDLPFMGGFDVFPGGSAEPGDAGLGGLEATALRELFEETGVLAAHGAQGLTSAQRDDLRRALIAGDAFAPHLERLGVRLATEALMPMGRWVTPPYSRHRFDARYFALELPAGEAPSIWPGELVRGAFYGIAAALELHDAGELFITYPVLETLRALGSCRDLAEASRALEARGGNPYPFVGGEMLAGVRMVPGRTPTLPPATHTNTYVLGGEELVIVDPATPYEDEQAGLVRYLDHLVAEGGKPREIWLTHHHHDHTGAVELVRRRYGIPLRAHPLAAEALAGSLEVDRPIADGEVMELRLGHGRVSHWQALHTPGHTRGHLCYWDTERKTVLTGDLVLGTGTVLVAPPEGDMRDYLASLRRLLDLELGFIFPAHGPPVAAAHHKIEEYLAHRLMRERKVVEALEAAGEPLAPDQLVPIVYADVDKAAWPLAQLSILAHLEKLVADGRASAEGGAFRLA